MTEPIIEASLNPPDLLQRMERYPAELKAETEQTLGKALYHVWGSVPAYPPATPGQAYQRTGTLGRSLGTSQQGGKSGKPEIFTIKRLGSTKYEARIGTRLKYAPDVIGTNTQRPQFKARNWWTMATVVERAEKGVHKLFEAMSKRLVKFLG